MTDKNKTAKTNKTTKTTKTIKNKKREVTEMENEKQNETKNVDIALQKGTWFKETAELMSESETDKKEVRWSSSNPQVAAVNEENGHIYGKGIGEAEITATAADGTTEQFAVSVTSTPVLVSAIKIVQPAKVMSYSEVELKAKVYPTNATNKKLSWKSSNGRDVFLIDGCCLPLGGDGKYATVTATATDGSGVSDSRFVQILKKATKFVSVSPCEAEIAVGARELLTATMCPWDIKYPCVEWSSTNEQVAIVNESGLVTGVGPGIALIVATAADGTGISDYCRVRTGANAVSDRAIEMIKKFEKLSCRPKEHNGDLYIGYGHRLFGQRFVMINGEPYYEVTEEDAHALMLQDMEQSFVPSLNSFLKTNNIYLNQQQYDACIDYSYAKGMNIWTKSTDALGPFLKEKKDFDDLEKVTAAFNWSTQDPDRRIAEAKLFACGTYPF